MRTLPDVLVLGAGGVLGEAWMMGVLAGIEDGAGLDLRECESFLGTSAGAIVAAGLAAGRSPRRPSALGTELQVKAGRAAPGLAVAALGAARRVGSMAVSASSAFAPLALGLAAPGGAAVRALILRGLPPREDSLDGLRSRVERWGARFDGRLRIVAVERGSGRRVVFGSPGAPAAQVGEAVQASCAVPWLFAPVAIGHREYVDGALWSPTNLDASPAGRETQVLCLNPTAGVATAHPLQLAVQGVARSAMAVEALALRGRGARVLTVAPDAESAAAMGPSYMDAEPRTRVLAAAYRQGLRVAAADGRW